MGISSQESYQWHRCFHCSRQDAGIALSREFIIFLLVQATLGAFPAFLQMKPTENGATTLKDDEMIRRCRKGDRQAQKVLFERFQASMFRLCYRYVPEQQEAEDILCKGLFKALQAMHSFEDRGENSLQKWISRIMVHEALMHLRKHKLELVSEHEAQAIPATTRTDSAVEAEELYSMVRTLPLGYRTVFNLFAIEGYSHQEIAAQLGISEGTSKSQLSKARAMLQEMLTPKEKHNATEHRSSI